MKTPIRQLLMTTILAASSVAQTTDRASLGVLGNEGNNISFSPSISADGRFVAFETNATNLIPGDSNANKDVLVRDTLLGVTAVISLNSAGAQSSPGSGNHAPDISADGRYVVFHSYAPNFGTVGDTTGVADIFLRDRDPDADGIYDEANSTTTQISLDLAGGQPDGGSFTPKISGDGTVVAFQSSASDLVIEGGAAGSAVFARDLSTGLNELISKDLLGLPVTGSIEDISRDGRYVSYFSNSSAIVLGDGNGFGDIFVYDRVTKTTARVSVDSSGAEDSNGDSRFSTLSADGRKVAFFSKAQLVADDTDFSGDIYVRDRDPDGNGIFDEGNGTTILVDRNSFGVETLGAIGTTYAPFISDDGLWVAFSGGDSSGSCCDLVVEDVNGVFDVILRDLTTGITTRISVSDDGQAMGLKSWGPSLSSDGRLIAFSTGSALDDDDTNTHEDIYVRDRRVWSDVGFNMAGSLAPFPAPIMKSVPTLSGAGSLSAGSSGAMTLIQAPKGASSFFVLGSSAISASFKGGLLVPAPDVILGPLTVSSPTTPFGGWTLPFVWPVGVPPGFTFWSQVWVADVAGPAGFVSSNAVKAVSP